MGNRVVAISGAGTGIGQMTALRFATRGWHVAIGGRRIERLAETRRLIEQAGGQCFDYELDVTNAESVEDFFAAVERECGVVTATINNAAAARYGPLHTFEPDEIHAEIATKLIGGLYMARRAILGLRRDAACGDILFITSSAGAEPWPQHLPYAAANAGVEHAASILRLELEGTGIRVTVLRCGATLGTDFGTRELETGRMLSANEAFFRHGRLRHGGLMTPDNVADAIVHAIELPAEYQYEIVSVAPSAPEGELPSTYDEWQADMVRRFLDS
jgi:NADP-dependent 3-hydroxy acid dehydrogenase YdfG